MQVQPAHIDQVRLARHGEMVEISADAGGVAADLKRIDPGLKVRFAAESAKPFFAVYHESEDGRTVHLVLTVQAYQTNSGVWTGLDKRVVKRIEEIDGHGRGEYDYAKEIQRQDRQAEARRRAAFREKVGGTAEEAAHAIRKDLGLRYKGRAFVPTDVPPAA